jgi:hypothetical protein
MRPLRAGVRAPPSGHIFCSRECRYGSDDFDRIPADPAPVERLFAQDRDPEERVRPDDWYPDPDSPMQELDSWDTVDKRWRWYLNLREGRRVL